jgi:macrolide-specific efflux system membrane fusion protein
MVLRLIEINTLDKRRPTIAVYFFSLGHIQRNQTMRTTATYLVALAMLIGSAQTASADNPVLKGCLISAKDDVQIPAQKSGILASIIATRGMQVAATQQVTYTWKDSSGKIMSEQRTVATLLVKQDDTEDLAAARVAYTQLQVAHEETINDVNKRFSIKSAEVAKAELEKAIVANRGIRGVVSDTEVQRLKLAHERALLQIEQSQLDEKIAKHTESVRKEEYQAALENVERRTIRAPFAGVVEDVYRQKGEYVREGDPVLRLIRLDELRVEGFVNAALFNPSSVAGRKVIITVKFANGESEVFRDEKITFVSSQLQAGGNYRVSADITNRKKDGQWLLRPGARAVMTILID